VSREKVNILLDSGAWSAWTKGAELSLKDYVSFIKRNRASLWNYISMDVIPGTASRRRDRSDVEKAAKLSYDNQQEMKAYGLSPWPVFHQGEDFSWLKRLLRDEESYIAVSTAKNQSDSEQERWLAKVMERLTNSDGTPLVNIHGLGNSAIGLLRRFPFASVDSAGWIIVSGWGIMVPPYYDGKPNFLERPSTLSLVGSSDYVKLGLLQRAVVERFLEEEIGCSVDQAIASYQWRRLAVIKFCLRAAREARRNMKYVFALAPHAGAYRVLRDGGSRYDLLSYFVVRNKDELLFDWACGNIRRVGYKQNKELPSKKRLIKMSRPSLIGGNTNA
jgi:hypothetical protein